MRNPFRSLRGRDARERDPRARDPRERPYGSERYRDERDYEYRGRERRYDDDNIHERHQRYLGDLPEWRPREEWHRGGYDDRRVDSQRERYGGGEFHPRGGRDRISSDRDVDYIDRHYRGYSTADRERSDRERQADFGYYGPDRYARDDDRPRTHYRNYWERREQQDAQIRNGARTGRGRNPR